MKIKKTGILCICLIMAGLILLNRFKMQQLYHNTFDKDTVALNLTKEEKLEDFEYFYDTVTSSMSILEDINMAYRIDFVQNKEKYKELINNTTDDYEFFCVMQAIVRDIPSFHTDLVYPIYDKYRSLDCYNMKQVLAGKNIKSRADYWYQYIGEQCKTYETETTDFLYREGEYVYDARNSENRQLQYCQLIAIDGIPIDEYITDHISISELEYDEVRQKPYRYYVAMNNNKGTKVQAEFSDENGATMTQEMYLDLGADLASCCGYLYEEAEDTFESESIDSKVIHHEIGYLKVDDFDRDYSEQLNTIINKEFKDCSSIVIDLRDNYGGYRGYAKNLYKKIQKKSFEVEYRWQTRESESNSVVMNEYKNILFSKYKKMNVEGIKSGSESSSYNGSGKFDDGDVYYLVGKDTGSAADGYVSDVKNHTDAMIIGDNTGGEGLADSFVAKALPNSGLVFIYMPGKALNADGSDNSVHGTAPDVYIGESVEEYYAETKLKERKHNKLSVQEELQMDQELYGTVQMIEASSNKAGNSE